MFRPPQPPPNASTSPPSLRLSLSSLPTSHLLPSERLALASAGAATSIPSTSTTSLPHSNSSPSLSTLPNQSRLPPSTSRNDLFALDWSPISPNTVPPPPLISPPASSLGAAPPITPLRHTHASPESKSKYSIDIPIPPPEIKFDLPPTPPQTDRIRLPPISTAGNGIFGAPISSAIPPPPKPKVVPVIANTPPSTAAQAGISDNPVLDSRQGPRLRLVPSNDFVLGEGRHATVFLASFVPKPTTHATHNQKEIVHPFANIKETQWKLCAAKRVLPDRESQLAGLGEAFVLSRLATGSSLNAAVGSGSRYIVSLYGVKDERDGYEGIEGEEGEDKDSLKRKRWEEARMSFGSSRTSSELDHATGGGSHPASQAGTSLAHTYLRHPNRTSSLSASQPPSTQNPNLSIQTHQLRHSSEVHQQPYSAVLPTRHSLLQHQDLQPRRQTSFSQGKHLSPIASPGEAEEGKTLVWGEKEEEAEDLDFGDGDDDEEELSNAVTGMTARERKGPRYSEPGMMTPDDSLTSSPPPRNSHSEILRRGKSTTLNTVSTSSSSTATTATHLPSNSPPRIILLLEYCPFGHVMAFLKSFPERMGKRRWIQWAKELAVAVCWAHEKGVLHADIKPQNVLIASDLTLRLSDFGMAMFVPPPGSSTPPPTDPLGLGTPPYSPPEFVRQPPSPFSYPSDIFSLGVTFSVMLTAREPYEGLRAVERMFYVQRGGYYDWDERRRLGIIGSNSSTGSRPASRQGSIKSVRSGRSRASSGAGSFANVGAIPNRARSDSIESVRSLALTMPFNEDGGEWRERPSYATAELAIKLLANNDDCGEGETGEDLPPVPTTPSPTTQQAFILPASPIVDSPAGDAQSRATSSMGDEVPEPSSTSDLPHSAVYPDGSPMQYFLDGEETVPVAVKELIKRMTLANANDRPTAHQVLAILNEMSE